MMYRVVLSGRTLAGTTAEQGALALATSFRLSIDRARSVIGRRSVIKRGVDEATAKKYVSALTNLGVEAWFEHDSNETWDQPAAAGVAAPTAAPAAAAPVGAVPPPLPPVVGAVPTPPPLPPRSVASTGSGLSAHAPPPLPPAFTAGARVHAQGTVAPFLNGIGMGHLAPMFDAHRVTPDMIHDLTDQDLVSIGVASLGERKRILAAARSAIDEERVSHALAINEETERAGSDAATVLNIIFGTFAVLGALVGMMSDAGIGFGLLLGMGIYIVAWIYFLPTYMGFRNQSEWRWAILIGNIFFGATLLGWLILLWVSSLAGPPVAASRAAAAAAYFDRR